MFGNMNSFKEKFANPINKGLMKLAKYSVKRKAVDLIAEMKALYTPFFKRRMKGEIFKTVSSELTERPLEALELPFKTDIVVWIPLSKI